MEVICRYMFAQGLDNCIEILEPIEIVINSFQNDHVSLSKMYEYFTLVIKQSYENMNCLSCEEGLYILNLVVDRLEFLYGDEIGISYILDGFTGKGLS